MRNASKTRRTLFLASMLMVGVVAVLAPTLDHGAVYGWTAACGFGVVALLVAFGSRRKV